MRREEGGDDEGTCFAGQCAASRRDARPRTEMHMGAGGGGSLHVFPMPLSVRCLPAADQARVAFVARRRFCKNQDGRKSSGGANLSRGRWDWRAGLHQSVYPSARGATMSLR
jgi:hypothetical protein